jgi:hypothetical protein
MNETKKHSRQALEDRGWFCPETSEHFKEDTWWNGNNHISCSTGSQWEHEELYRTKGGAWVRHSYSQMQGSSEHWYKISALEATEWLIKNHEELPDDLMEAADKMIH